MVDEIEGQIQASMACLKRSSETSWLVPSDGRGAAGVDRLAALGYQLHQHTEGPADALILELLQRCISGPSGLGTKQELSTTWTGCLTCSSAARTSDWEKGQIGRACLKCFRRGVV